MLNKKARIDMIMWVMVIIATAYFMNLGGTKDMIDNYMFGNNNTSTNLFGISNTTPETENLIDTQIIIQEDTNIEETFIDQYGFFIIILLIILLIICYLMYRYFSTNKSKQKPKNVR